MLLPSEETAWYVCILCAIIAEKSFPLNCLIIARLGFKKERVGHGTYFLRFLIELAIKQGFKHIGICQ